MNLLFFIETGLGNGRSMADEAIAIKKKNCISVCTVSSNKDQEPGVTDSLIDAGLENLCLEGLEEHRNFSEHKRRIRDFIQSHEIDIVHVQSNWTLLLVWSAIMGSRKNIKIFYTIHAFRNNKSLVKKMLAKTLIYLELFLFADHVFTCSSYMKENFKFLKYKMSLLPLGVDERYISHPLVSCQDGLKIIFPGMFREGKGQDLLINAFALYKDTTGDTDSKVYLPGDGELLQDDIALAKSLGLHDQIIFPGRMSKEELLTLYDKSNILACTSKSETFSQILAEGYCLGKCIISRPVGIAKDIVNEGVNGYLVADEKEFNEVLIKLSLDSTLIPEIGKNNYKDRMRFSWSNIVDEYINICQTV